MLFYADNDGYFGTHDLRVGALRGVERSSLVRRAASGELAAGIALHVGFWPFVREFERAIDMRRFPWKCLSAKFGPLATLRNVLSATRALKKMRKEEGSHATYWQKSATELGITKLDGPIVGGVATLIERIYTENLPDFFSTLAGTELVAEELSRFLTKSSSFKGLFPNKRWSWGDVHLAPHDYGPSHLDLDLDLARAYGGDQQSVSTAIYETVALFGKAAIDVERAFLTVAYPAELAGGD